MDKPTAAIKIYRAGPIRPQNTRTGRQQPGTDRRGEPLKRPADITAAKRQLNEDLAAGKLTIGEATRRMRKIVGMSQTDYAVNIVGISPRALMEIEQGKANPRLDTLLKIARPFGCRVGFLPPGDESEQVTLARFN
ncbi:MAG: DNA-binding XRE family transcriptional regulator [Motiliproteus sp.]|jgi:DNA-binding XRE family transcriptional regulator